MHKLDGLMLVQHWIIQLFSTKKRGGKSIIILILRGLSLIWNDFDIDFSFRNDKRYRRRREATSAMPTTATLDSCSEAPGGLNKSYRQAWDNLHQSDQKKPPQTASSRAGSAADPNHRTRTSNTEGARDDGEIVVDDFYAKQAKPDKKRHHHHHHHKHTKRGSSGGDWWTVFDI